MMSLSDIAKLQAVFPNGNFVSINFSKGNFVSINYLSLFSYGSVHVLHIEVHVIRKQNIFGFWLETPLAKH